MRLSNRVYTFSTWAWTGVKPEKDTEAEKYPSSTQAAQNAVLPTAWAESEKQLMKSADD